MPVTIDGTNGITNGGGYTGDGVSFADATPANTLVTTTGGNVGIGTASPGAKSETWGGSLGITAGNTLDLTYVGGSTYNTSRLVTRLVRTSNGSDWTTAALRLQALVDVDNQAYIDMIPAGGTYGMAFGTGTGGTPAERMRIDSAGNVAIGATAAASSTIGNVRFTVKDGIVYNYQNGPAGYQLYNGGATAEWFMGQRSSSDHSYKICTVVATTVTERLAISAGGIVTAPGVYSTAVTPSRVVYTDTAGNLGYNASILAAKTNIADLTDTEWLAALHPITFNYRKLDEDRNYTDEAEADLEYGLIAEEVEGVNTELVFYDETENGLELRGVHYNKLIVPLLAEVQKLRAELNDTKARLAAVEGAIA